ncbi:hypothetical protein CYY_009840 [Polysphondylium violaceum]|uniref:GYF domain-containing protein n=1 Tax=Polysphondylium violaceum TaxID=133409 RepID=A0A8J4UP82_9MYCE|nr:hypothetical protein CYY_009840 [Polysphondylium violaceum]
MSMNRPLNQQQQPGVISPMKVQQSPMNSSPDYFMQQQQQQRGLGGVVSPTFNNNSGNSSLSGSSNRNSGSWGGLPTQQQTAQAQQTFNQFFNKNNNNSSNNIYSSSSNSLRKSGSTNLNGSNSGLNLNSSNNIPSNGGSNSKTKYSKDELLNLYDPSLAVPDTLVSHTHILSEEIQTPINFNYDNSLSKSRDRSRMTGSNSMINQRRSKDLSGSSDSRKPKWANSSSSSHSWRREDDRRVWYYLDPNNVTQGPFSNNDMDQWYKAGYFPATLLIRKADGPFVEFKKLLSTQYPFSSSVSSNNDFKVLEKEDTSSHSTSGENDSHDDDVDDEEDITGHSALLQHPVGAPANAAGGGNDDADDIEQNIIKRLGKDLLKPQTLENQDKSSSSSSPSSNSVGGSVADQQHQSISSQQDPLVERTSSPQYSIHQQPPQQRDNLSMWMNQQQQQQPQQQQQQQQDFGRSAAVKPENDVYSKYMAFLQLQHNYQIAQQNLALLHSHIQQLQSQQLQLQSQPSPQAQLQMQQIQQLLNNQNQHYYMLQQKAIQLQIEMFQLQQQQQQQQPQPQPQPGFPSQQQQQQQQYIPPIAQMMKFQQQIQQQQPIDQHILMDQQAQQKQETVQEQQQTVVIQQEITQTSIEQQPNESNESESENEQILWGKPEPVQEKPTLQTRTETIVEQTIQEPVAQQPQLEVEQPQQDDSEQIVEQIANNLESNVVISNPWATAAVEQPTAAQVPQQPAQKKKSLVEIQMEELKEQKKKEAEDAKQKLIDAKNQPNLMKWGVGNSSAAPSWSVETVKPMSLKEIQEEEKISREKKEAESVSAAASVVSPVSFDYTVADSSRKKISFSDVMKEQSKEKKDSPVNNSSNSNNSNNNSKPTFNPSSPWSVDETRKPSTSSSKPYTSVSVKSNEDSFWEAPSTTTTTTKTTPSLSVRSNTPSTTTTSTATNEFPTLNIMSVKPATIVKATPNPVLNIKKSGSASGSSAPRPDFIKWCHNELKPLTNNDVATLTELFCSLKTEGEIRECIKECLGYTSEVNNFINEYLLARSDEPGLTFESSSPVITIPMKNKTKSTQSSVSKSSKKKK